MLCCAVLCCAVLCCAVMCRAVLWCAVMYCAVLFVSLRTHSAGTYLTYAPAPLVRTYPHNAPRRPQWSTAIVACEGGETDFWYPLKTSDLVASGRGVMEIQKGALSATRNQKRNLHDAQLRKPPSGPYALIRTTCEDLGKASVDTQESHTGTPKSVPENVTWRSRPD